jgi:hypothetical protein
VSENAVATRSSAFFMLQHSVRSVPPEAWLTDHEVSWYPDTPFGRFTTLTQPASRIHPSMKVAWGSRKGDVCEVVIDGQTFTGEDAMQMLRYGRWYEPWYVEAESAGAL